MFRGSKVEDAIEQIERLKNQSKERAERYAQHEYLKNEVAAHFHEGAYQAYKDIVDLLKQEFHYPDDSSH